MYPVVLHNEPGEDEVDVLQGEEATFKSLKVEPDLVIGIYIEALLLQPLETQK